MKYFIPLFLLLSGCGTTVKQKTYPIDPVQQEQLTQNPAPIMSIDTFKLSVVLSIISVLIIFGWLFIRKSQKSEASTG